MATIKTYVSEARQTIPLALPIIASQLGQISQSIIDNIMVGKVGVAPLAGAAFANSLFAVPLIFAFGISAPLSPLVAEANASGRIPVAGKLLRQGTIVCMATGAILALATIALLPFLWIFNQPAEVNRQAGGYLFILAWSLIPVMGFQSYRLFTEGLERSLAPFIITFISLGLNAFLNWVLIYGNLGAPRLELLGSGWATLIARIFAFIAMMAYVHRHKAFQQFKPSWRLFHLDVSKCREIIGLGLPSGFQYLFEIGAFSAAGIMAGWIGTKALAAHQIAINLSAVLFMVALGLSFASSIKIGNALGRGDLVKARNNGFSSLLLIVGFMLIMGVLLILGRHYLPTFYVADIEVIQLAGSLLLIAACFQLADGTQAVGLGLLRGLKDVKIPTFYTFIAYWVVALPCAYLFAFVLGLETQGIWLGLLCGLCVSSACLCYRFHRQTRKSGPIAARLQAGKR